METLREIRVIAAAEFWRTLRSARVIVLLLLYLAFTGVAGFGVHGCTATISRQTQANVDKLKAEGADPEELEATLKEYREKEREGFVRAFFSEDDELVKAYLATPLALLVVFKLTLFFLPLYAGLMGFDQIAGEIGPRSIRYLVVRSRRQSILLGKFIAQLLLLALLTLGIDLALGVYGLVAQNVSLTTSLVTLGKFWGSGMVFATAYLALTALCSSASRQPALSLVNYILALFGVWFVAFLGDPPKMGEAQMFTPIPGLRYASVWYFRSDLLHPTASKLLVSVGAHLGFAALFLALAWVILRRRDV